MGLCPHTPGICRAGAIPCGWLSQSQKQKPERRIACGSGSWSGPASRRSGRIPALPYPPLRSALLYYKPQPDKIINPNHENICTNGLYQGINTLVLVLLRWPVLKRPPMAGFQTSTEAKEPATPKQELNKNRETNWVEAECDRESFVRANVTWFSLTKHTTDDATE